MYPGILFRLRKGKPPERTGRKIYGSKALNRMRGASELLRAMMAGLPKSKVLCAVRFFCLYSKDPAQNTRRVPESVR